MKKIIFKTNKIIFFTIKNIRVSYYKAKLNNKKVVNKIKISKDKFYKDIIRLKKSKL